MAVGIHDFTKYSQPGARAQPFPYPAPVRLSPLPCADRMPSAALAPFLALAALAGCSAGHRAPTARFDGALFPPGVRAPAFTLANPQGRLVSLSAYRGRVTVLAFIAPGRAGTLVAQQIRGALDELAGRARKVGVVLISEQGLPARAYARAREQRFLDTTSLAGRAQYLLGTPRQVKALSKAYGIPPAGEGERAYLASTPVILIDRAGLERVGFPVEQLTPEGLAHDIDTLLHR